MAENELRVGEVRAVLPIGWDRDIATARVVHFLGSGVLSRFDTRIVDDPGIPVINVGGVEIPGTACWHMSDAEWQELQQEHVMNGIAVMPADPETYMQEVYPSFNKKPRHRMRLPRFLSRKKQD